MMNATGRAANLKALISDNPEIRSQASEAIKVYEHGSIRDSRGIRLAQMLDPKDTHFDLESRSRWGSLSVEERQLLQSYLQNKHGETFQLEDWMASGAIMDQITIAGVRYAQPGVLKRDQDSHIILVIPDTDQTAPGKILKIFQFWYSTPSGTEYKGTYLIVDQFSTNPTLDIEDPYRKHPTLFGYLCNVTPLATRIIEAEHVRSHFALTPRQYNGVDFIHVYPMSRVCLLHHLDQSDHQTQVNHEFWWRDAEHENENLNEEEESETED